MKKVIVVVVLMIFSLLMMSCHGEFKPDPLDPRLPAYSEEGLGSAGAFVNNRVWRYLYSNMLFGYNNDFELLDSLLIIRMNGDFLDGSKPVEPYIINIIIKLPEKGIDSLQEIEGIYEFSPNGTHALINYNCKSEHGQIFIRKAKITGNHLDQISGTFSFHIENDSCTKTKVTHGRFDLM